MTLYTPLGLAYQAASDRPCDAPGVWCSFVDQMEVLLLNTQASIDRLNPAVPLARVRRSTSQVFATVGQILWDTVSADTDNMVDLSRSRAEIRPNRNGRYQVHGTMIATGTPLSQNASTMELGKGAAGVSNPFTGGFGGGGTADSQSVLEAATYWYRGSYIDDWDDFDKVFPGFEMIVRPSAGGVILTVTVAEMTVYWVDDGAPLFPNGAIGS